MSQLPSSASPTRLSDVDRSLIGRKLRVAGRLLSYDEITGTIVIVDGVDGLFVDVTGCLDSWVREKLGTVMVIGDLQEATDRISVPKGNEIDAGLVLRAIHVGSCGGVIDLEEWNAGMGVL